jgi:L-fucose isomerase-like protein
LGVENTYGAMKGRTSVGPMSFARISTDDREGRIKAYVGEGRFTDDPLDTFGTRAVVEVPGLQQLMHYICKNGFEHHVAMTRAHVAPVLKEAFETYLGWETYQHQV